MPRIDRDRAPTGALGQLAADVRAEASRAPFDRCRETYETAGRPLDDPVLLAGSTEARVCCLGRELGRDEVIVGEPLVGIGGRRLRRAAHEALVGPAAANERRFADVLDHLLLTNLVPYRPVGNKAYGKRVRERFRPFVERVLTEHFAGDLVIPLGQNAVLWFEPYAPPGTLKELWADRTHRFRREVEVAIRGRSFRVAPVPHPSPLSPFKAEFAARLAERLASV